MTCHKDDGQCKEGAKGFWHDLVSQIRKANSTKGVDYEWGDEIDTWIYSCKFSSMCSGSQRKFSLESNSLIRYRN